MVLIFIVLVIVLCMVTTKCYDTATQIITLEETNFLDPDYEVDEDVSPYVLTQASSQFFVEEVNSGDEAVLNLITENLS